MHDAKNCIKSIAPGPSYNFWKSQFVGISVPFILAYITQNNSLLKSAQHRPNYFNCLKVILNEWNTESKI